MVRRRYVWIKRYIKPRKRYVKRKPSIKRKKRVPTVSQRAHAALKAEYIKRQKRRTEAKERHEKAVYEMGGKKRWSEKEQKYVYIKD